MKVKVHSEQQQQHKNDETKHFVFPEKNDSQREKIMVKQR